MSGIEIWCELVEAGSFLSSLQQQATHAEPSY
jgi:hypothetical protein